MTRAIAMLLTFTCLLASYSLAGDFDRYLYKKLVLKDPPKAYLMDTDTYYAYHGSIGEVFKVIKIDEESQMMTLENSSGRLALFTIKDLHTVFADEIEISKNKTEAARISKILKPNQKVWNKIPNSSKPALAPMTVKEIRIDDFGSPYIVFADDTRDEIGNLETLNMRYFLKQPKWPKVVLDAVFKRQVRMGMSEEQAIAAWGQPEDIKNTVGRWGTHSQWVYSGSYLYFENHKLTGWQN